MNVEGKGQLTKAKESGLPPVLAELAARSIERFGLRSGVEGAEVWGVECGDLEVFRCSGCKSGVQGSRLRVCFRTLWLQLGV